MNAMHMVNEFTRLLLQEAKFLNEITPETGINIMLEFYQRERIEHCDMEHDGDMLLFQWGTYDFRGKPEFQINITRQIFLEEEPHQLQLTFYYAEDSNNTETGDFWCSKRYCQ